MPITTTPYLDWKLREAAIEIERTFFNMAYPKKSQYVVLNHSNNGVLVACLVQADSQEEAVERRAKRLGTNNTSIFAVSGVVPSEYGAGGSYLHPVDFVPPPQPKTQVVVGSSPLRNLE